MNEVARSFTNLQRPQHPTEEKIERFRSFLPGWFYGDGVGFTEATIEQARELNSVALSAMLYETDIFPSASGELLLTVYYGDSHLELTIENDGTVSTVLEQNGKELSSQEDLSTEAAKKEILNFRELAWKQSDSSLNTNGIIGSVGSQVSRSGIQATTRASRLLIESVQSTVTALFVRTSLPTTPLRRSTPSYSGHLISHSYHPKL